MATRSLSLIAYPYDHVMPLAAGQVKPEGVDLSFDFSRAIDVLLSDPSLDGGEFSIGRYLILSSGGPHEWVGLPIIPLRSFRHRCFLVKRGSDLQGVTDLRQLEGRSVGLDAWPNTGNTWTRLIMRAEGVDLNRVSWVIAPTEGPVTGQRLNALPDPPLPNVRAAPDGMSLVDLLLRDELDVAVIAFPPRGFYEPDSPIVHMITDYRAAEREFYRRHGYIPGQHLMVLRRAVFERDPWLAGSLLSAYEASKRLTRERRRKFADGSPWMLADLEDTAAAMGEDWLPYGLVPNLGMLSEFCQDQVAQGLLTRPLDVGEAFTDFSRAMNMPTHA